RAPRVGYHVVHLPSRLGALSRDPALCSARRAGKVPSREPQPSHVHVSEYWRAQCAFKDSMIH
ncbi:hypothetical protein B0T21DRAFT_439890, partial [Apiosordaria backusii]